MSQIYTTFTLGVVTNGVCINRDNDKMMLIRDMAIVQLSLLKKKRSHKLVHCRSKRSQQRLAIAMLITLPLVTIM